MHPTMRNPSRPARRPAAARPLAVLTLEDRVTPALAFAFDYSLDRTGFFNNPAARAALERAAADLGAPITSTPAAITPGGVNTWTAVFDDPSAPGSQLQRTNLSIPAGTQYIFAGGIPDSAGEAGLGGYGGFSVTGSRSWQQAVRSRGQGGFAVWGGSISFDVSQGWYYGADPAGRPANQLDFTSVAVHELTHSLGFGTSPQFAALSAGGLFTGAASTAANGGLAPLLSPDGGHWIQGTRSDGHPVSLQPTMEPNGRVTFSRLDYAGLSDIGWQVGGAAVTPIVAPAVAPTVTPAEVARTDIQPSTGSSPAVAAAAVAPVSPVSPLPGGTAVTVVSGASDGTAQAYTVAADGTLAPVGGTVRPFAGFGGAVRSVVADFNGDGVADLAFGTGPGANRVRVFDGKTGADLTPEFAAFEPGFAGGVFLAAGDFDHDGRAELVVTPDQGGGPRVRVLSLTPAGPQALADFFGIEDANFRGGARAAVGDVDGDGTPDLVVAAGYGGGPRVAVFNGRTVPGGGVKGRLTADFFAFETTLRNGVYVSAGDVDGDGKADLTFGAGPGGGPRVVTVSGQSLLSQGGAAAVSRPLSDQFVGDTNSRGGVRVTTKQLDGGGRAAVVAGSGTGGSVQVIRPAGGTTSQNLLAGRTLDGVYVG